MKKLVVFGLIYKNQFLVMNRPSNHVNKPGSLTLPAGHVEDGETSKDATYRELKEEFDMSGFEIELLKGPYPHLSATNKEYEVYFYLIKDWDGQFVNVENQDVFFMDLNEENIGLIEIESSRDILREYISKINCI
ncbi:NUDIX hydrolase [Candidatus Woesearchaeota archaeon]|nr:NUDIX hydrolase [Candidatus Woesearchaeota archaeon]